MFQFKDLFVSYGRRESLGFVARVHQQLKLAGYDIWFDKVNIPDAEPYDKRISHGIESAHNFAYVMAPRCMTSPYCLIELEYARILGKRVIPINQAVIFNTDSRELSEGDKQVLKGFYQQHHLADQNIQTTQDVLNRSHTLVGTTDWLDAKENLTAADCDNLAEWARSYENDWKKHEDLDYLATLELPVFGTGIDPLAGALASMKIVLERHRDYVHQHTKILDLALAWERNQQANHFLLVSKEREAAEEWLLKPFRGGEQPPCSPSALHSEFICESRKNAENTFTAGFVCYDVQDKAIRDKVVASLSRYAITTWRHDQDIQTGIDYDRAIEAGIEQADNFFYFISPQAVSSEYCQRELAHALKYNKRIIPLLITATDSDSLPTALRNLQHIDFTNNQDQQAYNYSIDEVLNVLNHDKDYYEQHKILLTRALKWESEHRQSSFLLRGYNLENAKTWLQLYKNRAQHPPTPWHQALITESEAARGQLSTEVFISYSRKDGDFARRLNIALQEAGKTTWFDQESISTGVDFEKEIFRGINSADNFVFVLSPDAVSSEYCEREVDYAAEQGKRFIPLLCRDTAIELIPKVLQQIQWIDFKTIAFEKAFAELIQTIELDREHARQHTVLQQRVNDWLESNRSQDFLLNITACNHAETWRNRALAENKQPAPTSLQRDFIQESRNAIAAAESKERRRRNIILGSVTAGLVFAIILSVFAFIQKEEAQKARKDAEDKTLRTESLFLASRAENLISKNQSLEAITVALQGLPKPYSEGQFSRPYIGEAAVALNKALDKVSKSVLLEGHEGLVWNAVFSPDGKRVATASGDKTVRIWDSQSDELLLVLLGHESDVSGVAFEPTQGQRLVTSSKDQTARIWDSQSGKQLQVLRGHVGWVTFVAFSPDGQRIVTASEDKTVRIWDSQTGQSLKILKGHEGWIETAVFSPDEKYVLTASHDQTARLWDSQTGELLKIFKGHKGAVRSAVFSPNGYHIATASGDRTVQIWNSQSGQSILTLTGHQDAVGAVVFSPDGRHLATASDDGTVRIWDSQNGKQLQILSGHESDVNKVNFSPDGQHLVTASSDYTARIWTWQSNKQSLELLGHKSTILDVTFSPDGRYLATASEDKTAWVWNSQNGQLLSILRGHDGWVKTVAFSPNSQYLITASGDKTARIWDSQSGKQLLKLVGHQEAVLAATFSSDGRWVATASKDRTVRIWDSQNGKLLRELQGHKNYVSGVAFSPDNQRLLTASEDTTARLWDSHNGKQLLILTGHKARILSAHFNSEGNFIVTASDDGTARVWNSYTGELYLTLEGHTNTVMNARFSNNGQYIATASTDGTVRIWDTHNGEQFLVLEGTADYAAAFSPDNQRIAIASADGIARIYSLPPPLEKLINNTWESWWPAFTPLQREVLLLYILGIDRNRWKTFDDFEQPENTSQNRLHYLWNEVWPELTPEEQEKLSLYVLRLAWQSALWEKTTSLQLEPILAYLSHPWQNRTLQYFNRSLLHALEKQWSTFNFQQQEQIIKTLTSGSP